VVGKLWTSLFGRVVVSDRQPPTALGEPETGLVEEPALGMKLTGEPHPLDRMVTVQPNTVVVLFEQDTAPRLKFPGEYLTPGLLPSLRPVQVLAVNTGPVDLDVTVDHLVTMDGHDIEKCMVRVTVVLSDRDRYASVAALAAEFGTELEAYLLQRVETDAVMGMHAAVKMNRLADLRRSTVQQELAERWLPRSFAGGALVRRDFDVREITWPKDGPISVPIPQTKSPKASRHCRLPGRYRFRLHVPLQHHLLWNSAWMHVCGESGGTTQSRSFAGLPAPRSVIRPQSLQ